MVITYSMTTKLTKHFFSVLLTCREVTFFISRWLRIKESIQMQWIDITVQQIKIAIFRHKCWIHDLSLAVWNQIAKQLAMTKPQLLSAKTTSPALWDTKILRLWNWYCRPSLALSYNPEKLKFTDPDTAGNETYLFFTPIRGVGYCTLTTWTKSAKYWISHTFCIFIRI